MKKKVIAFYLPQYHPIPENDYYWGKGFTEWTNVRKAKPLFEGHNQPRIPLNDNYYSLLDIETLKWQEELMKRYSIYGLCIYHYWFKNGKKLLEKPLELLRDNPEIDIKYCLSWANENWSKNWDGGHREVICEQDYGGKADWQKHFDYFLSFFHDRRYIKVNNRPMILIYKPFLIPKLKKMISFFDDQAKASGFDGIYVGYQYAVSEGMKARYKNIFDFSVMFEPVYTLSEGKDTRIKKAYDYLSTYINPDIKRKFRMFILSVLPKGIIQEKLRKISYDDTWHKILTRDEQDGNVYPGAFPDWDNTARKKEGMLFQGVSAEKFREYFNKLVKKYDTGKNEKDFIFINAWNEWGEGCYIEPDTKNGYAYLEAICEAVKDV